VASICAAFAFERATSSQSPQQQDQPRIERTATVSYVVDGDTIYTQGHKYLNILLAKNWRFLYALRRSVFIDGLSK